MKTNEKYERGLRNSDFLNAQEVHDTLMILSIRIQVHSDNIFFILLPYFRSLSTHKGTL